MVARVAAELLARVLARVGVATVSGAVVVQVKGRWRRRKRRLR